MTAVLIGLIILLAVALVALAVTQLAPGLRRPSRSEPTGARRILFPFSANALSQRALDAALRLASAEDATLVPIFLARVPLDLPLDAPLPHQSQVAIALQEAIDQRASSYGVPLDPRVERGRTYLHALRQTISHERFDRMVIAAAANHDPGFNSDDVAWLLDHAPGEIVVLRPSKQDQLGPPRRRRRARVRRISRAAETAMSR